MTEFQQDLIKIILDKALFGSIALAFGYYLSRLLEKYRSQKTYDLSLWQERVEACKNAIRIVSGHHDKIMGLYDTLELLAQKYPEKLTDKESKRAYDYCRYYDQMKSEIHAIMPFLHPVVIKSFSAYLDETSRLTDIVKGKFDRGKPTIDDLLMALARFHQACWAVISAGPFGVPQIEEK